MQWVDKPCLSSSGQKKLKKTSQSVNIEKYHTNMVNSAFVNLPEQIRKKGKVCRRANIFQKKEAFQNGRRKELCQSMNGANSFNVG